MTPSIDTSLFLPGLTAVSNYIGETEFDKTLFNFLNTSLYIDHFAVFTYSNEEGAGHLFTRSIMPDAEAEELAKDYVDDYHQRDPHFKQTQTQSAEHANETVHPSLPDEYDPEYRDHFFTQHDLIDKVSVTRKVDEGYIYCNFYRIGESGQFSDHEKGVFDRILPLITNLIVCHFKILRSQGEENTSEESNARSLVHSVISSHTEPFDKLTARESEVCERILVGFTSTGIALDLGIAESSVNTYRRRSYEKLGIASQNELFSLCIFALNKRKK